MKNFKLGFTLAEVLITLAIIGVVAALTLPTLLANYRQVQFKNAYKKAYAELVQATSILNVEYSTDFTSQCKDFDNRCFRDLFAKQYNVTKTCNNMITEGCQDENSLFLNGQAIFNNTNIIDRNFPGFITNRGASYKFRFHKNNCDQFAVGDVNNQITCGWVQIDVNGLQKPNVAGKDIYFVNFWPKQNLQGAGISRDEVAGKFVTEARWHKIEEDCKNGSGMYCSYLYLKK